MVIDDGSYNGHHSYHLFQGDRRDQKHYLRQLDSLCRKEGLNRKCLRQMYTGKGVEVTYRRHSNKGSREEGLEIMVLQTTRDRTSAQTAEELKGDIQKFLPLKKRE